MKRIMIALAVLWVGSAILTLSAGPNTTGAAASRPAAIREAMAKLRPLHTKMGEPQGGDWVLSHPESGQTFEEYLKCSPNIPDANRRTIYIQPLGDFTKGQRRVVDLSADLLGRFYGLPVKTLKDLPLATIPDKARRAHPTSGDKQILTPYVLDDLLKPRLPADAFALIAFTASDLWPGAGWNFVFGQASLRDRVGVWSIYRFGNADGTEKEFTQVLMRACRTGTHELGHMFTIQHCIAYECGMCGSNNLPEADRRPMEFCPECVAKIWHATGVDPIERCRRLWSFCHDNGLAAEEAFYAQSLRALGGQVPAASSRPGRTGPP
jgi:archaemetzincin